MVISWHSLTGIKEDYEKYVSTAGAPTKTDNVYCSIHTVGSDAEPTCLVNVKAGREEDCMCIHA
jgi:hypothetical protein